MAQSRYDLLIPREDGEKTWWTKIGAAFENRSGDGYQLIFEALPIPGKDGIVKVVMKRPLERDDREPRRERESAR